MIAKIKGAFNYLFNRIFILRDDIKNAEKIRKNLEAVFSQDKSILDKYGFIQGTDKASVMNISVGGGKFFAKIIFNS